MPQAHRPNIRTLHQCSQCSQVEGGGWKCDPGCGIDGWECTPVRYCPISFVLSMCRKGPTALTYGRFAHQPTFSAKNSWLTLNDAEGSSKVGHAPSDSFLSMCRKSATLTCSSPAAIRSNAAGGSVTQAAVPPPCGVFT